jgi:hypothetical protein
VHSPRPCLPRVAPHFALCPPALRCRAPGLRPLYNVFAAAELGEVGFQARAARRPALGLHGWQWLRLAEQYGLLPGGGGSEAARQAFKTARGAFGGGRQASGANTGAAASEPAGGGRLQFAGFVRALGLLASQGVRRAGGRAARLPARASRGPGSHGLRQPPGPSCPPGPAAACAAQAPPA